MIPRTFPSTYASNGQQQMLVHFLTDVTGLQRWSDYIPVKLAQTGTEDSYANNGYIDIAVLSPLTASTQAWKEYIPVYVDDEATDTWTVNATGYIPYGYALFGDASMQLDFTNGAALDSRITFTRASNATVTNSAGVIAYAPHNLLTYSEEFDNAVWAKTRSSISANTAVAPNGTTTADKLVENTDNNSHQITQTVTTIASTTYAFSVYLKAGERSWAVLNFFDGTTNYRTWFNLSAGTVGSNPGVNTASISNAGNGWYRCTISRAAIAASSTFVVLTSTDDGVLTYLGDGTSGIFLWGAQLNVGALQSYYPTTVKNLLGYTEEFDNAAWIKTGSSVTANTAVAPDGSLTADVANEGTAAAAVHSFHQAPAILASSLITFSTYAKNVDAQYVGLAISTTASGNYATVEFDLASTGAINRTAASGTGFSVVSSSITPVGSGWFRCAAVVAVGTATVADPRTSIYMSDGTASFDGRGRAIYTGTSRTLQLWGAQLSDSASLDQYVYNPVAAPAAAAYYGPRFDYDPATLAPLGLLIEESRTNLLAYSDQFDNAFWIEGSLTSQTANTVIAPDGTLTGDTVTATGSSNTQNFLYQAHTTSVVSGSVFTFTVWLRADSPQSFQIRISNASNVDGGDTSVEVGTSWQRYTVTRTFTGTSTGVRAYVLRSSEPVTFYAWGAQLEAGAFATSYIPTVASQVTRAADLALMTGTNFSSWYNQAAGTLFVQAIEKPDTTTRIFAAITDGTTEGYAVATFSNTGRIRAQNVSSSGIGTTVAGQSFEIGYSFESGAQSGSLNGSAIVTTATTVTTVPTLMRIGCNQIANSFWNSHLSRIAYYPRRLANAELQAITV